MRIKKTSSIMTKNNNHQLSTALTTLTCMLAGMFMDVIEAFLAMKMPTVALYQWD